MNTNTTTPAGHVRVCQCCLLWLVNRDACDCPPDSHPQGLLGRDGDPLDALGSMDLTPDFDADSGSGVADFSGSPCEGCVSWLAGSRYRVAVWAPATTRVLPSGDTVRAYTAGEWN